MAKTKPSPTSALPSFEEALAQLEATVHDLEDGQIGLEESLARYENGVKLLRHCYDLLTKAQRRVELLSGVDAQGNPVTRPIEEEPSDTLEEKARRRSRRRTATTESDETTGPVPSGDDSCPPADGGDDVDEPGRLF
jgi:exodeoxyribonuclease VII small subunit